MSGEEGRQRVAVLIDGDNAKPDHLDAIVEEVARFGVATIKRIYGDWASGKLNGWTKGLHFHAAQAIQQHNPVSGKNATDGALIIDAMDLLYGGHVDAFCIVSSDSDYAALAKRLRASAKVVYGIGAKHTPEAFVRACDEFSYTENFVATQRTTVPKRAIAGEKASIDPKLLALVRSAVDAVERDDGWAHLAEVGAYMSQKDPGFDPRSWGYPKKQLIAMLRTHPQVFELRSPAEQPGAVYVRINAK